MENLEKGDWELKAILDNCVFQATVLSRLSQIRRKVKESTLPHLSCTMQDFYLKHWKQVFIDLYREALLYILILSIPAMPSFKEMSRFILLFYNWENEITYSGFAMSDQWRLKVEFKPSESEATFNYQKEL